MAKRGERRYGSCRREVCSAVSPLVSFHDQLRLDVFVVARGDSRLVEIVAERANQIIRELAPDLRKTIGASFPREEDVNKLKTERLAREQAWRSA